MVPSLIGFFCICYTKLRVIVVRPHWTVLYLQPQKFITALRSVSKRVGGPAFWGCLRVLGFSDAFSKYHPTSLHLFTLPSLSSRQALQRSMSDSNTYNQVYCLVVCKRMQKIQTYICVCMYCHNMMTHTYVSSYCNYYYVVILPLWWWRNIRFLIWHASILINQSFKYEKITAMVIHTYYL